MRSTSASDYERYLSSKFLQQQRDTERQRADLLPILGLSSGQEDWFQLAVKPNLDEFAGLEEVQAVRNLLVVHYIEVKDKPTPWEVLASVRGTIVYSRGDNKYFIIRKSIPYTSEILLDKFQEIDSKVSLSVPQKDKVRQFKVDVSSLHITPYIEGTVIDIMKIDGTTHWFTSHNVLPKGVKREGRVIYKSAHWAEHHIAFTTSFEEIIRKVDPAFLNEKDELFPKNCLTSNKLYRFVLLNRERVRAEALPVNQSGILVYIGCLKQFEYSDVDWNLGEEHTSEYVSKAIVSAIPADLTRPFIVHFEKSMSLTEANSYLAGPRPDLGVLSGGGKLIVRARVIGVASRETITFHVKSSSYDFREKILGNNSDLYKQLLILLDFKWYDFSSPEGLSVYYKDFPNVVLPSTPEQVQELKAAVASHSKLFPTLSDDQQVLGRPITHVWYIFLLCVNVSIRQVPARYLERYSKDISFLVEWMTNLDSSLPFSVRPTDKEADKRKAENRKNMILSLRTEISRSELYHSKKDTPSVLLYLGDKTARAIAISRKETGTSVDSIRISEPDAMFQSKTTYASVTKKDIPPARRTVPRR